MPAFPARARAAMRSLFSRPQPSSARMSTATVTNCSDSSALSGRPGVPLTALSGDIWSCALGHPGPSGGVTTMTMRFRSLVRAEPERIRPVRSGARRALHVHLEARAVVPDPPLVAGGGDHALPALRPVRRAALGRGGGVQGVDGDEAGLGVLQPAQPRLAQRLVG